MNENGDQFCLGKRRPFQLRLKQQSARLAATVSALFLLSCCLGQVLAVTSGQTPTYYRDMAPIFFRACASCHRADKARGFAITSYTDALEHAEKIGKLTLEHKMPPWPMDPICGEFVGARVLSEAQIQRIRQWVEAGAPAGDPKESPPLPEVASGWTEGKPDMVLKMPIPFTIAPGTHDLYRSFVIPVALNRSRYVRALELRPVNNAVIHHGFVYTDRTGYARQQDGRDGVTGYAADMDLHEGIGMPGGQFLTWQPGKIGPSGSEDMSWLLATNTDLVLALHLNNDTGQAQVLQAEVGLYFTDSPPKVTVFKLPLFCLTIDLPAGATNQWIEDRFTLPVDVEARAVMPHAHYLARRVEGWATLPDGTRRWLVRIPRWDFNWQGEYRYAQPLPLPRGSVITMHYEYDNSTNNPANPNHPPARVRYGAKSTDEMAELWLQITVPQPADLPRLEAANNRHQLQLHEALLRKKIADFPEDGIAHSKLGLLLMSRSNGMKEAGQLLQTAVRLAPENDETHYALGLWLRIHNRTEDARHEFETTIRINRNHYRAHGNLGLLALETGDLARARLHLQEALKLPQYDFVWVAGSGSGRLNFR